MNDTFLPGSGFDTYESQDKVLMQMDGSTEAAVAVRILQQQGFAVVGAVVRLAPEQAEAAQRAKKAAEALGIECILLNAEALAQQPGAAGAWPQFAALLTAADKLGIKALAPDLKIIAPWRCNETWKMQSREDEIEYCKAHGIDLPFDAKHSYSRDRNLWHISHEGLELEDPACEPNYDDLLVLGVSPEKAPDEGEYVTMTFEAGVPKSLNGKEMKVSEIITELNKLGGKHGIGIVDIVENRVVGMKSRGVYETPGGTILMEAHDQLEELVLDRATYEVKKDMGNKMAQIVYEGKWFTPLREAVQAFVDVTQQYVTGEVKFKLYKGNIIKAGTTSPYSLYSESLASFTTGELYDHHDAEGFINLFGLPLKVRAMKMQELEK